MKINTIYAVLVFSLLFNSCTKSEKINKTFESESMLFFIDSTSKIDIELLDTSKTALSDFYNPSGKTEFINSITLSDVDIEIIDSTFDAVTFDIIEKVFLEIESVTFPIKKIASKNPVIHNNSKIVKMDLEPNINFADLGRQITTYHLKLTLNKKLNHPIKIKMTPKWKVLGELKIIFR